MGTVLGGWENQIDLIQPSLITWLLWVSGPRDVLIIIGGMSVISSYAIGLHVKICDVQGQVPQVQTVLSQPSRELL